MIETHSHTNRAAGIESFYSPLLPRFLRSWANLGHVLFGRTLDCLLRLLRLNGLSLLDRLLNVLLGLARTAEPGGTAEHTEAEREPAAARVVQAERAEPAEEPLPAVEGVRAGAPAEAAGKHSKVRKPRRREPPYAGWE